MNPQLTTRPSFFGRFPQGQLRFWQRDLVESEGIKFRDSMNITRGDDDNPRIGVFIVDAQYTFMSREANQLYVPGSEQDLGRALEWMMKNITRISKVWATIDTHVGKQIFHRWLWRDKTGKNPSTSAPPFPTVFPGSEFRPTLHPLVQEAYVAELLRLGQPPLTVWPTHSLLGEPGHALMVDLFEVLMFRDIIKDDQSNLRQKGTKTYTEAYGAGRDNVIEVTVGGNKLQIGEEYTDLMEAVDQVDQLVIWGEALDFCVRDTTLQILAKTAAKDPKFAKKIWVLGDCMSSIFPNGADLPNALYGHIPNQPKTIHLPSRDEIFGDYKARGMNVVSTTDPDFLLK